MGDRTAFQCAMIYNDQKDCDWFHPWLSQYGRTKRRTVGNRQQRFLSSANAMTARPESAEKPPKGTPCLLLLVWCCEHSSPVCLIASFACGLCFSVLYEGFGSAAEKGLSRKNPDGFNLAAQDVLLQCVHGLAW